METEALADALERDHRMIDEGIAAFMSGPQAGDKQSLLRAIGALRRHIYLKEALLFPMLVENEPALTAPVFVMLREHGELWQLLDSLEQELARSGGDALALCRKLTILLVHHNPKEERVLYPQADELLAERAATLFRDFIAAGQLPPGWACAKAGAVRGLRA